MRFTFASVVLLLATGCTATRSSLEPVPAPVAPRAASRASTEAFRQRWAGALDPEHATEIDQLCAATIDAPDSTPELRAEALICRATVTLREANMIAWAQPNGTIIPAYEGPRVGEAVRSLRRATELAPEELQPRRELINVCLNTPAAGQALLDELKAALEHHHDKAALDEAWRPLTGELLDRGQMEMALEVLKLVHGWLPDEPQVVADVGAVLMMLDRGPEARPYVERAVRLQPNDAINVHNLGEWQARYGDPRDAVPHLERALELETNEEQRRSFGCLYAAFLRERLKEAERAKQVAAKYGCE